MTNGQGLDFTHDEYKNGNTLISFDLNPLDFNDSTLFLEVPGTVKLELSFSTPLSEAHTLIVYSEHQQVIELDIQRQVYIE